MNRISTLIVSGMLATTATMANAQTAQSYFDGYAACTLGQLLCFFKGPNHPNGFARVLWGPMPTLTCEEMVAALPPKPRENSTCLPAN